MRAPAETRMNPSSASRRGWGAPPAPLTLSMQSTLCQSFWGVGGGQGGAGAGSPLSLWVGRKGPPCPPGWDEGDFRGQHLCSGKYMSCGGALLNPRGEGNRAPLPSTPGQSPTCLVPELPAEGATATRWDQGPPSSLLLPSPDSQLPGEEGLQPPKPPVGKPGSRSTGPGLALSGLTAQIF